MNRKRERSLVALVDDDPRMLESLEDLLDSSGYSTCSFSSAAALLARGLGGLDLLIADIGMPGTDGFALAEMSRVSRPDLPIILITGRHELAEQARSVERLFRKPFDARKLLAEVDAAMGQTREQR